LRQRPDVDPDRVWILAEGSLAVAGLFALALDQRLAGGILERCLLSYSTVARTQDWDLPYDLLLYGVLKEFDLPHVAASLAPRPLLLLRPVDPTGQAVSKTTAATEHRLAVEAYEAAGASTSLRFQPRVGADFPVDQAAAEYLKWLLAERR
jgi:hypothetical protein